MKGRFSSRDFYIAPGKDYPRLEGNHLTLHDFDLIHQTDWVATRQQMDESYRSGVWMGVKFCLVVHAIILLVILLAKEVI